MEHHDFHYHRIFNHSCRRRMIENLTNKLISGVDFYFFRCDFGHFLKMVDGQCVVLFFIVFRGLLFANLWGEYGIKNKCFLTIPILASWDFNENMMPKTWFREVHFQARVDHFWGKSLCFQQLCFLENVYKLNAFATVADLWSENERLS